MIITDWSYVIMKNNVKVEKLMKPKLESKWNTVLVYFQSSLCTTIWNKKNTNTNLWQLHLHVGKNMKEPNHSVPQPAVSETLLVANARSLETSTQRAFSRNTLKKCPLATSVVHHTDLYVLRQGVEDLLGHCQGPGEVPLACFIHDILPRVVPVEITYGFLIRRNGKNGLVLRMKESGTFSD